VLLPWEAPVHERAAQLFKYVHYIRVMDPREGVGHYRSDQLGIGRGRCQVFERACCHISSTLARGIYVEHGDFEFVLAAASLAIALTGTGHVSADEAIFGRMTSKLSVPA